VVLAAACGRTGLLPPSDDDAAQAGGRGVGTGAFGGKAARAGAGGSGARGGASTSGGAAGRGGRGAPAGRDGAGGFAGSLGVGGTATGGTAGFAGAGLTQAGGRGDAGDAGEAGAGGEAGASTVPSCVVRVNALAGDDGDDGKSWAHAVATLTRALSLAEPGCEVWLAGGTYTPASDGDRSASFQLPDGVALRGGFAGDELKAADRRFLVPLPSLSGNLGSPSDPTDNSYHVVVAEGDATLDHVELTGGYADDGVDSGGAAIAAAGELTLEACTVSSSYAKGNGGAVAVHGPLTVTDSWFGGNGAGNHGGAIFADASGPVVIERTEFQSNSAHDGGALYVTAGGPGASASITNGTFDDNGAIYSGGAVATDASVSLSVSDSSFVLDIASVASAIESAGPLSLYNTSFSADQASSDNGAVVHATGATTVTRCNFANCVGGALVVEPDAGSCSLSVALTGFSSNSGYRGGAIAAISCSLDVTGSSFSDNAVEDYGGAIYAEGAATSVTSSDFSGNSAQIFGGAIYASGSDVALQQSNFAENTAEEGGAVLVDTAGLFTAGNCTFQANTAASVGGAVSSRSASSTLLVSTLFARNTAVTDAAAVYSTGASLGLTNVTVTENATAAGAAVSALGPVFVANSIFWNDTPAEFALSTATLSSEAPADPNLVASNLSGTYPNLTAFDPEFVDAAGADYRLSADSACIDNADDSRAPAADLDGRPRVSGHDGPCPACRGVADMGAYEYGN
jgi:predicted outer membrane repeat protein